MAEQLKQDLIGLGLQRYVYALLNAGYNDWEKVADMTERDFDALGIRLGDRRKLQREIARRQLWPENSPLPTSDELREFTLSLQGNDAEAAKNGLLHSHVTETLDSGSISPNGQDELARSDSSMNIQDDDPGSVGETSRSSSTVPTLNLDADRDEQVYDSIERNISNPPSITDINFDDDETPRATENSAVSRAPPN